ncbi:pyrroline-5-carboxylate reductase [Desulfuribacillus alkaliarsenatis]|uniref:Pyrroline-5-carboxylate reductase n=1 Tax=Desulfuribacillus alkaliarsenatis TaxID=766136 RepID=A0A1E5FYJ0_9FIRM|nr:pyrroline-5-carboxylate reductase [Desulfuribacillus alkaliarsenatis]OEF95643.1 pyrroline-5-carboxylate reductase [Desulfuribacillus alkaliarsenatis]
MPHRIEKIEDSIFFVGAGAMAEAIIKGLVYSRIIPSKHIYVTNKNSRHRLLELKDDYEIKIPDSLEDGCKKSRYILLAVKPWTVKAACENLKPFLTKEHVIISIAAGVTTTVIEQILGSSNEVIRTMPNTSSAICESATGICGGKYAKNETILTVKRIFETVGEAVVVKESQIDAVTALCGSGPAYIYYLIEGLEKAGINQGLNEEDVRKLVVQTVYGAAKMLVELHAEPAILRKQVTTPNGTTEAGLKTLEKYDLHEIIEKTIESARERAKEIGKETEKEIWNTK